MRGHTHIPIVLAVLAVAVPVRAAAGQMEMCGARLDPEIISVVRALHEAGVYAPIELGAEEYQVPITYHIVRRDDGSEGLPPEVLVPATIELNSAYVSAGIEFYQLGPVDFIDSDHFYFDIDTHEELDELRMVNRVEGTINVYWTLNANHEDGFICGTSSFSSSSVQGIVIKNACVLGTDTLAHEVGHYFDLFHTHATNGEGAECADGSNCATAGDYLCDTPADPNLTLKVDPILCLYIGTDVDPCGDPYTPDTGNFMSYSLPECKDHFSPQQEAKVIATLTRLRPELLDWGIWVDFAWGGPESGTYPAPYDTLPEALLNMPSWASSITMKAGGTSGSMTISDPVTLRAYGGSVTLGQ